ncbi:unnamed protein product [Urochloa humidicola]
MLLPRRLRHRGWRAALPRRRRRGSLLLLEANRSVPDATAVANWASSISPRFRASHAPPRPYLVSPLKSAAPPVLLHHGLVLRAPQACSSAAGPPAPGPAPPAGALVGATLAACAPPAWLPQPGRWSGPCWPHARRLSGFCGRRWPLIQIWLFCCSVVKKSEGVGGGVRWMRKGAGRGASSPRLRLSVAGASSPRLAAPRPPLLAKAAPTLSSPTRPTPPPWPSPTPSWSSATVEAQERRPGAPAPSQPKDAVLMQQVLRPSCLPPLLCGTPWSPSIGVSHHEVLLVVVHGAACLVL